MARMVRRFWAAKTIGSAVSRACITYSYWHDLKTDLLRRPISRLDAINIVLRRFRLVLVRNYVGDRVWWCLRGWLGLLDEIHEQGRCEACEG